MSRREPPGWRTRLVGLATLAVAGLTSCSGGPQLSRGSVAGCVRSLPVAHAALRGATGRLVSVHRVPADKLPPRVKAMLPPEDDATVCAIAFKGSFTAGRVTDADATAHGDYAVVLVDARRLTVVGSYVGNRLPPALHGHLI